MKSDELVKLGFGMKVVLVARGVASNECMGKT